MNFCSHCAAPVTVEVPAGDNRPRHVCRSCGRIHYENPRVVVGCVPEYQGSILLCRRAIEPRLGFWTMPAGFMELGETLGEAAIRETWEESQARVELGPMFAVVDVVMARQVHVFFRGTMAAAEFGISEETLETRLFLPEEIPWAELAFPSVRIALEQYVRDTTRGQGPVHLTCAPRVHIDRS